ncbi:MAG: hypothetical protein ABI947_15570 [Chloroflexota bacterium]
MTVTIADVASLIVALSTTGSLLYIARQVSVTRRQTKGQFLLALDEQFEKTNGITVRLVNEEGFHPVSNDWPQVWALMSVFERINIMVDDKILDVGIVDRLYGFRLVSLLANDDIYQRLAATGAEWQDFIDLCYAIANHRQRRGLTQRDTAFVERVHKLNKESRILKNPFGF